MVQKKWKSLIMLTIAAALLVGAGEAARAEEPAGALVPAKQEAMAVPRRVTYTAEDKARYEALREKNEGRLAPKERFLTTTAQKVVLTFCWSHKKRVSGGHTGSSGQDGCEGDLLCDGA